MQKIIATAIVAGAAALSIVAASAADLRPAARAVYKAPMAVAPVTNWTGLYVGVSGGYGWSTTSQTDTVTAATTGEFKGNGGLFGGTLGYNWQFGQWVLGAEGDYSWAHIEASTTNNCAAGCNNRLEGLGTARARLGYSFGQAMVYATGGAAFGHIKSWSGAASGTDDKLGWTAGGGVEMAFAPQWSAKLEYLHVNLGETAAYLTPNNVRNDYERVNILRAGINYRFGGPVVANY